MRVAPARLSEATAAIEKFSGVRPHPEAAVSTPVGWDEIEDGISIEQFTVRNVPARVRERGDLWEPVLAEKGRFRLEKYL